MKKLSALCLTLLLVISFVGCSHQEQENGQFFFTAKVIEVHEEYLLLEVLDTGTSNLSDGTKVEVLTDVVSAEGCPEFVTNEYARVLLAKDIEDIAPRRLEALAIYKTDKIGKVTSD